MSEAISCTLVVDGMHCAACELLIEKKLKSSPSVESVKANLTENKVYLKIKSGTNIEEITPELNDLINDEGYTLHSLDENIESEIKWHDLIMGAILAFGVIIIFVVLQISGVINILRSSSLSLGGVFLIGLIASISSCMAVVGGLVLSMSSAYAMSGKKSVFPILGFHFSRVVGFFILGGILGLIGSTVGSSFTTSHWIGIILNILIFVSMFTIGFQLLGISKIFNNIHIHLPKSFGKSIIAMGNSGSMLSALLLGVVSFFLPCGFTQSMQLVSFNSGSFIQGALTMGVFSLGTLPMLGLVSFSSYKFAKSRYSGIFYKASGFIVIFFALLNLLGALSALGIIPPILNI